MREYGFVNLYFFFFCQHGKTQWGGSKTRGRRRQRKALSPSLSHPTGGVFGPAAGGAGGTGGTSATDAAPDHHPVPRVGAGLGRVVPLLDRNTLPRRVRASRRPISSMPLVMLAAADLVALARVAASTRARQAAGGGAMAARDITTKRE